MSGSKVLKCANCNIVISELLAFLQNKVDVMDNESMVRICASTYTISEVEKAKALLFDTIKTRRRNISRRKEGKIQRDLEDIITVLKETDPDVIPVYVARDLNKIPVFCYDHLDPSVLLKDIVKLKADVQEIKQTYATVKQIEELENHHKIFRPPSFVMSEYKINKRRGGCLLDSGPMGFLTPRNEGNSEAISVVSLNSKRSPEPVRLRERIQPLTQTSNREIPSTETCERSADSESEIEFASLSHSPQLSGQELSAAQSHAPDMAAACSPSRSPSVQKGVSNTMRTQTLTLTVDLNENGSEQRRKQSASKTKTPKKLSFAELVGNGEDWIKSKVDDSWIQVQRKRLRNRFVGNLGKAEPVSNSKFKAADTKAPLFVSNVHKDVLEKDIIDYIYEKTKERVSLFKMRMKFQRDYNAYKIFVNKNMIDVFLDDKLWPSGITFRRFISLRKWHDDQCESTQPNPNSQIVNG